jgi:Outer membrane protein beta-barrel domain
MKTNFLFILVFSFAFLSTTHAQRMAEPGVLGAGIASSYPAYGVSAKYNFTETHAAQLILGGASYGYDSTSFSFGVSGRYLYNFDVLGDSFFFKPYGYAQLSYFTVKYDYYGYSDSFNTIGFGLGGGVECEIPDFVEGLTFSGELGYVGGDFGNGIDSFAGLSYGASVHYYFDF